VATPNRKAKAVINASAQLQQRFLNRSQPTSTKRAIMDPEIEVENL